MKRILTYIILIMCVCYATAQTQQGIVKTRGRMVNGQLVAGQRLSGATITLNFGNALVSGNNGGFSFNVPSGKTYSLVMAKKQGYTLADPEYTQRSFKYSASNPFYVVLEDENQRQADINAATKKVRRTLTAQLQKREDEIEALKEQNKITEAEYQKKLQELYDNQSKSEQLVKEMAERYASTDYDQLDEFNRKIQMYIIEGELQRADSLIRSKGEMSQRIAEYHNAVDIINKEKKELQERESILKKNEKGVAKEYDDISQDLLQHYVMFMQKFQPDSALYCLRTRADLDTTNMNAVWHYAQFALNQKKHDESFKYFKVCERFYTECKDTSNLASVQTNIAAIFNDIKEFEKAEEYNMLALKNYNILSTSNPAIIIKKGIVLNNMGTMYREMKNFLKARRFTKQAVELREKLYELSPESFSFDYAVSLSNLAGLHFDSGEYSIAEPPMKKAVEVIQPLYDKYPEAYSYSFLNYQHKLGIVYTFIQGKENLAEPYLKVAMQGFRALFDKNPDAFKEDYTKNLQDLGLFYVKKQIFLLGETYLNEALKLREDMFASNPQPNRLALYQNLINLGSLYDEEGKFAKAEEYYNKAWEHIEYLYNQNSNVYRINIADYYTFIYKHYGMQNNIVGSEKYYNKAINEYVTLLNKTSIVDAEKKHYNSAIFNLKCTRAYQLDTNHQIEEALQLAKECYYFDSTNENYKKIYSMCVNDYAYSFAYKGDFKNAIKFINQAIELNPSEANSYDSKGEILLMQGKNKEALTMWKKVLELNPNFLKDFPDGTELSKGLKKKGLIE